MGSRRAASAEDCKPAKAVERCGTGQRPGPADQPQRSDEGRPARNPLVAAMMEAIKSLVQSPGAGQAAAQDDAPAVSDTNTATPPVGDAPRATPTSSVAPRGDDAIKSIKDAALNFANELYSALRAAGESSGNQPPRKNGYGSSSGYGDLAQGLQRLAQTLAAPSPTPAPADKAVTAPPEPPAAGALKAAPPEPPAASRLKAAPPEPPAAGKLKAAPPEPPAASKLKAAPPEPPAAGARKAAPPEPPASAFKAAPPEPPSALKAAPPEPPKLTAPAPAPAPAASANASPVTINISFNFGTGSAPAGSTVTPATGTGTAAAADSPLLNAFKGLMAALNPASAGDSSAAEPGKAVQLLQSFLQQIAKSLGGDASAQTLEASLPAKGSLVNVTA
jgi:hypothetical protein